MKLFNRNYRANYARLDSDIQKEIFKGNRFVSPQMIADLEWSLDPSSLIKMDIEQCNPLKRYNAQRIYKYINDQDYLKYKFPRYDVFDLTQDPKDEIRPLTYCDLFFALNGV